ncbi:hypothetical protein EJB05_31058 [Eragrostis curvula]|uniref:Uncharacterized protein n=1 Tax=Eragrostis curvula TaxID=38414 RepID=A0A5J9UCL7_9POAL|nr:hypothetical protein EJB05_31058 [Eragrostis curvula]
MNRLPHPRSTTATAARVSGMWNGSAAAPGFSQFAQGRGDPEASGSEGVLDQAGVGSMRHQVVPPSGLNGRMTQDPLNSEQFDVEEASTGRTLTAQEEHAVSVPSMIASQNSSQQQQQQQQPSPPVGAPIPTVHHDDEEDLERLFGSSGGRGRPTLRERNRKRDDEASARTWRLF